jgi:hypothetical protein
LIIGNPLPGDRIKQKGKTGASGLRFFPMRMKGKAVRSAMNASCSVKND